MYPSRVRSITDDGILPRKGSARNGIAGIKNGAVVGGPADREGGKNGSGLARPALLTDELKSRTPRHEPLAAGWGPHREI
jgi:hypothetical protein